MSSFAHVNSLVSTAWAVEHLNDPAVKSVDVGISNSDFRGDWTQSASGTWRVDSAADLQISSRLAPVDSRAVPFGQECSGDDFPLSSLLWLVRTMRE